MQFEQSSPIPRSEFDCIVRGGDPAFIAHALVRAALHDPDWRWVQEQCLALLDFADANVSSVAATTLGHLAKIHGRLDVDRVVPALWAKRNDPEIGGVVDDALDDICMFIPDASAG